MILEVINGTFSICSIDRNVQIDWTSPYTFVSKMEEECSLVCLSKRVPEEVIQESKGWRAFYMSDIEDKETNVALVRISDVLAKNGIAMHVITTFKTNYILVKDDSLEKALTVLRRNGYGIHRKEDKK